MRTRRRWLAIAALVLCGAGFAAKQDAGPRSLRLLYTNDLHAQVEPIVATWLQGAPRVGGFAALSGLIARLRAERERVVLVDAGDLLTGPALSTLTQGRAPFELFDALEYDAMALGNHEFDAGLEALERNLWSTGTPVLGANVYWRGTNRRFARPYVLVERGGVRVAVLGVIGEDAAEVTLPQQVRELEFRDPAAALRPLVEALRGDVDLIVVLAHQGKTGPMQSDAEGRPEVQRDFDADVELARAVAGIDVLVGGHAHRGIDPPFREPANGTVVVQTYGHSTTVGVLDLEVAPGGGVAAARGRLERVWSDRETATPEMARRLERWRRVLAEQAAQPVTTVAAAAVRAYSGASSLGNLVTDLLRARTGADVALYNAGGLRADLPAGRITFGDVISVLPFNNRVEVVRLCGAAILAALEHGLAGEHGMLQQSGMSVRFDPAGAPGHRVVSVEAAGAPLKPEREYLVATIDFMVQGGDGYRALGTGQRVTVSDQIVGVLVAGWLREAAAVVPGLDDRTLPVAR